MAFVRDVHSRMVVGWQVANYMRTELPLKELEMALWGRRNKKDSGLIHHSERLHSALDYVPPAAYGEAFGRSQEQTPQSA